VLPRAFASWASLSRRGVKRSSQSAYRTQRRVRTPWVFHVPSGRPVLRAESSRPRPSRLCRRTPTRHRADDPGTAATLRPAVPPRRRVPRHRDGADHQQDPPTSSDSLMTIPPPVIGIQEDAQHPRGLARGLPADHPFPQRPDFRSRVMSTRCGASEEVGLVLEPLAEGCNTVLHVLRYPRRRVLGDT
jgi:hypothetical protein